MSRIERLVQIIEILQSRRQCSGRDLAEQCQVHRRTIYRDIQVLQDAGMNIIYDDASQNYVFLDQRSLVTSPLNPDELLSIIVILQAVTDGQSGLPLQHTAQRAVLKLASQLPYGLQADLGALAQSVTLKLDTRHPYESGQEYYQVILQAIRESRSVRIEYESVHEQSDIQTLLSPYRLFFNRHSWYLMGRSSVHREVRTFHLGRFREAELTDKSFSIPERFSLERQLGYAWNLIRGEKRYSVIVHFSPKVAPNVASVQWHCTQQLSPLPDGGLEFRAEVDGLNEILWWVLGYGAEAKVIEPVEFVDQVRDHAKKMLDQYP